MPKPTAAEALALLKEAAAMAEKPCEYDLRGLSPCTTPRTSPHCSACRAKERLKDERLAGLVAELYEGANSQHPACNRGPCRLCDARSATEDTLVAWAEGVGAQEERHHGAPARRLSGA